MQPSKKQIIRGTPESDFKIEERLMYALLKEQHPDLAHLPLRFEQVEAG